MKHVFRHFAVANGFMTSISYPQMVQGLQIHSNDVASLHDQTHVNPLTTTSNRTSLSQFYQEISRQPMTTTDTNPSHNQYNQNVDNLSIRSLSNTIEII